MDPDIQFGDLEHTPPATRTRPESNGQLVVRDVYAPSDEDLSVYVDLDVMREMIDHAWSDRRVELGGVLLGGQYADEQGRPFVLITDCLRARHYESTKGSFKFTHDTWEQITRDREGLPTDLQMVGWYHTHPDWGVFLSGLDLFICDHFFNKPYDVALVIDPCQADTGFFQWTGNPDLKIRRTSGYHLFSSRFRDHELREFVLALEGQVMPESARSNAPLNIHVPPPPPAPAWQTLAVLGSLGMQFLLAVILALRLLPGSTESTASIPSQSRSPRDLASADEVRQREAEVEAKLQVLDSVLRREGDLPQGVLQSLADKTNEVDELRTSLRGQQSLARELDSKIGGLERTLQEVRQSDEQSRIEIANLQSRLKQLSEDLRESRTQVAEKAPSAGTTPAAKNSWSAWFANGRSVGLGAFLGAAAVGVVSYVVLRRRTNLNDARPNGPLKSQVAGE